MFLSNLLKLGLHKSSCILFSCLFFVSCNIARSKPTEVVSTAGSRKIASASAAAMAVNSSAFLMMQACPVLASIQSRIPSWGDTSGRSERNELINHYNAEYVMNMLQETDSQGRTLHQRLMLELSSNSDCLSRIGDLRENICFYREYSEACEALHMIDKLKRETIIQEFEEFAGASIESIDPSQLAGKIDEFIENSKSRGFLARASEALENAVAAVATTVVRAEAVGAALLVVGVAGIVVAAVGTAVTATAIAAVLVGNFVFMYSHIYKKRVKNRKKPN